MAGKPEQFTVQQVISREEWPGDNGKMVTYELLFADDSDKYKAHVPAEKDPGLEDGKEVEGWKNPGGKFGIATGSSNGAQRSPGGSSGAGTSDDTRDSIERQVASRDVLTFMAAMAGRWEFKRESFPGDFDFLFDKVYGRISERV